MDELEAAAAAATAGKLVVFPTDTFYGARRYGAEDPEGHRWYFAQTRKPARKAARRKAAAGAKKARRAGKRSRR